MKQTLNKASHNLKHLSNVFGLSIKEMEFIIGFKVREEEYLQVIK